jgi:hypothetical protein
MFNTYKYQKNCSEYSFNEYASQSRTDRVLQLKGRYLDANISHLSAVQQFYTVAHSGVYLETAKLHFALCYAHFTITNDDVVL